MPLIYTVARTRRRGRVIPKSRYRGSRRYAKGVPKSIRRFVYKAVDSRAEPRYHHSDEFNKDITSTIALTDLSSITQGDTATTREGDLIRYRNMSLRFHIIRDSTATAGSVDDVRIFLFKWFPDSGSDVPTALSQFFQDYAANQVQWSQYTQDLADRRKFKVLYDRTYTITNRGDPGGVQNRNIFIPGKKLGQIRYTTGATSGKGKIYLLLIGTQVAGTENTAITYQSVSRFTC